MGEKRNGRRILPADSISVFCLQLALVLRAGMTVQEGISTFASCGGEDDAAPDKSLINVIRFLDREVREGMDLSAALKESGAFPDYMANMTLIGEKTGKLDNVLQSLSDYYERMSYLDTRIRNTLVYPAFLFAVMTAVIILLVGKVFPVFEDMISELGGSLSDGTSAVSAFTAGILAGRYTMIIMIVLSAIAITALLANRTKAGRELAGKLAEFFPPTKRITSRIAASRFSSVLSLTLSSGMDLRSALEFAAGVVDNPSLKKKFVLCLSETESGKPLYTAIKSTGIFSALNIKFIEAGIKSGSADEVMDRIAGRYETETDEAINRLTSLIEPTIIGVLTVIIGVILISVMLPLVSIMSGL